MQGFEPKEIEDDGLTTLEVKPHSLQKYRLVNFYAHVFASAMRKKWQNLIFVDLFSGPGISEIAGTGRLVEAPPLTITRQPVKFDRYLFCDLSETAISALAARISKTSASSCSYFHVGDCNSDIDEIACNLPRFSSSNKGLTLCYVDPFKIADLKFETLKKLSKYRVDFLTLIPTGMDAHRNLRSYYSKENSSVVADFLGTPDWRDRYTPDEPKWDDGKFFLNEFVASMERLGYRRPSLEAIPEIRHVEKNVLLYHLALFSKADIAGKFWQEGMKSTNPQRRLFD